MWRQFHRENVLSTLAKSPRYHSSAEDALEPFNTSTSIAELNGSTDIGLNASQLEMLNLTFDPQFLPTNANDEGSYREFFRQGRVYLVGIWHGDKDCVADVRRAMRLIRPDAVMVELCARRDGNLYVEDDLNEFRAAFEECENLPDCRLVLGDRDYRVTDKRVWNVIGFLEICRIAKDVLWLLLTDTRRLLFASCGAVFQNDEAKQRAADDALDQIYAEVLPEWFKATITERDLYMTHVLHNELESLTQDKFSAPKNEGSSVCMEPVRVVAIVGRDRIDGIKAIWGKRVDAEAIEELLTIPRNKWSKWIPVVAIVLLAIVVTAFAVYRAVV
ncbi:TraB family protein [Aphelenchoides avenae]|nr:TraB family protein [Aphelenchus avenae]